MSEKKVYFNHKRVQSTGINKNLGYMNPRTTSWKPHQKKSEEPMIDSLKESGKKSGRIIERSSEITKMGFSLVRKCIEKIQKKK